MSDPGYNHSVFINCPFDQEYKTLFEAIVFTIHDCGFVARSAWEFNDSGVPRIHHLVGLIESCRLGIHDLSRTEGTSPLQSDDVEQTMPRFNMPLELGMFLGARYFGGNQQKEKRTLILDTERYRYQQFCSDIAGQDPAPHNDSSDEVIKQVRKWLRSDPSVKDQVRIPGPVVIRRRYEEFLTSLPFICEEAGLDFDDLDYNDYTTLVVQWIESNPSFR